MDRKEAIKFTISVFLLTGLIMAAVAGLGYLGFHVLWNAGHKVLGGVVGVGPVLVALVVYVYLEARSM